MLQIKAFVSPPYWRLHFSAPQGHDYIKIKTLILQVQKVIFYKFTLTNLPLRTVGKNFNFLCTVKTHIYSLKKEKNSYILSNYIQL